MIDRLSSVSARLFGWRLKIETDKEFNMILSNQARCKKCNDEPYSAHRHDFKYCQCGAIAVDGGMDYLRRVGNFADFEDMAITIPEPASLSAMAAIDEARSTGRNALGILSAAARALRDNGVDMIER